MPKRRLHLCGKGRGNDIRLADTSGRIVCTLPREEARLARFIVRCVKLFGFGLRPYNRSDWLGERNTWRP